MQNELLIRTSSVASASKRKALDNDIEMQWIKSEWFILMNHCFQTIRIKCRKSQTKSQFVKLQKKWNNFVVPTWNFQVVQICVKLATCWAREKIPIGNAHFMMVHFVVGFGCFAHCHKALFKRTSFKFEKLSAITKFELRWEMDF